MGGVCQFPQGAALFPIWCLLFIAIAMGIVCVWVGGWWAHASPPHFFGGKFNNYLRRRHFVGKDTYRPCYRNGPATLYTSVGHQLTLLLCPLTFIFVPIGPNKSLKN